MARKDVTARYREKHREKIREWNREYARRRRREQGQAVRGSAEWLAKRGPDHYVRGERHGNWKGDQASYAAIHHWLARWATKTGACSWCNRYGNTTWANLSGDYRRDVEDFIELCPSCHKHFDLGGRRQTRLGN